MQKNIEVDLALITYYDELLRNLELAIVQTAKQHDAHTLYLLQTVPGIGKILSLVLARLEKKHDKGKALSILAHTLGRAVYDMLKHKTAFDMALFLHTSGRRADALAV